MQWHRLDKEKADKVLEATKTIGESSLFPVGMTEVKCANLPFYNQFVLYRMTNYITFPIFTMDFLSDGERFFHLNGTFEPIRRANETGNFNLNEDNILKYLNFYYENVTDEDGELYIIESPDDLPFVNSLESEQQNNIKAHHKPANINISDDETYYIVNTSLFNTGSLMNAEIRVTKEGIPTIVKQHLLLSDAIHAYAIKAHN